MERYDNYNARDLVSEAPISTGVKHDTDVVDRVSSFASQLISAMNEDGLNVQSEDTMNASTADRYPRHEQQVKSPSLIPKDSGKMYKEYIRLAVKATSMDGMVLENYPGLWDNKEVVLSAVRQNAEAFRFASARLKDDDEVFIAASTKDEMANVHGSKRLRFKHGFIG